MGQVLQQPDWSKWTQEQMLEEYDLCATNPLYFFATWYLIVDKHQRTRTLVLNYAQQRVRSFREKHRWIAHGKARKKGITTEKLADMVWACCFLEHQKCICLAQTHPDALKIGKRVLFAVSRLPEWMTGKVNPTRGGVEFVSTGSWIRWQTYDREDRGDDLTRVLFSEASLYDNMLDVFAAVNGSLVTKQPGDPRVSVEIESTGRMGPWEEFWNRGRDGYHRLFIGWQEDPDAISDTPIPWDEVDADGQPVLDDWLKDWLRRYQAKHQVSERQLAWWFWEMWLGYGGDVYVAMQENPGSPDEMWRRPGDPFFAKTFRNTQRHPSFNMLGWLWFQLGENGRVEQLDEMPKPTKGRTYVIGVDAASGSKNESASFAEVSVHDATDWKKHRTHQIGAFKAKVPPGELASVVVVAGLNFGRYHRCVVVIEAGSFGDDDHGAACQDEVIRMCRHHPKGGRIKLYMRRTKAADQKFDVETKKFGWSTTGHTRPVLLKEYKKWLDKGHFKLIDPRQQEEHNTFVHNEDGRPEALEGAKDDGVMCNAFVVQGYSQQPAPDGLLDEDEYPYRPQELLQLAAKHRTTPDKVLERFRHRAPKRPLDLVSDDHVTIWDLQIPT